MLDWRPRNNIIYTVPWRGMHAVARLLACAGYSKTGDMTQELAYGYWPSYNVPFFAEVYRRTGYNDVGAHFAMQGEAYRKAALGLDYQLSPRAKIFRRDAGADGCGAHCSVVWCGAHPTAVWGLVRARSGRTRR